MAKQFTSDRTQGDGMEYVDPLQSDVKLLSDNLTRITEQNRGKQSLASSSIASSIPGATSIYRLNDDVSSSVKLPAKIPQGKLFYLVPHLVNTKRSFTLKNKEPKFVPFEPYKAAVNPMVPEKYTKKQRLNRKNNLDLNVLVSHVSNLSTNELNNPNLSTALKNEVDVVEPTQRLLYEKQITETKKDRDYFESQLKFQAQVNSELKNLLVAAVGEDLQTKVNVLTEDKLQLARALLNSAHNLSTHTEQIEYLASQSEVWRSKFLASSLMVEELARWKASLMQKNKLLLESNKQMLETMSQLRDMQKNVLKNLKFLAHVKTLNLPSSNVLDITSECLNISEQLVLHSGIGMPSNLELMGLDATTASEKLAIEALQNSNQALMSTDAAFKAIVEQAFPVTKIAVETQTDTER